MKKLTEHDHATFHEGECISYRGAHPDGTYHLIPAAVAEQHDRVSAAKDAVVQAARACHLRGHGKSDALRLSYALDALKAVQDV